MKVGCCIPGGTYILHTLFHSSPMGAFLPYMNIEISSYLEKKKKGKKLFADKNVDYENSLHFNNKSHIL